MGKIINFEDYKVKHNSSNKQNNVEQELNKLLDKLEKQLGKDNIDIHR